MNVINVTVGSDNPVKIESVRLAFKKVFRHQKIQVYGYKVPSGVSDQPLSDKESLKGARIRAKNAYSKFPDADFAVGLEGGLQKNNGKWFDCGWMVVLDKQGREGIATTLRMETPPKFIKLVDKGMEIGEIDDLLFKRNNSKQAEGHFGLMTGNKLTRTESYRDGVIAALVRFTNEELFKDDGIG